MKYVNNETRLCHVLLPCANKHILKLPVAYYVKYTLHLAACQSGPTTSIKTYFSELLGPFPFSLGLALPPDCSITYPS